MSRFSCQVFRREMGVSAIGVCVSMAKQQCEKVAEDSLYVTLSCYYHYVGLQNYNDCNDNV